MTNRSAVPKSAWKFIYA